MNNRAPHVTGDEVQEFIAAVPHGRSNAVTGRTLAARLGLTKPDGELVNDYDRFIRARREAAILEYGVLVSADDCGYFIPDSRDEALPSIRRKWKQVTTSARNIKAEQTLLDQRYPVNGGRPEPDADAAFYDLIGEQIDLFEGD